MPPGGPMPAAPMQAQQPQAQMPSPEQLRAASFQNRYGAPEGIHPGEDEDPLKVDALNQLDGELADRFKQAEDARREIEEKMVQSRYRRDGRYTNDVLAKLTKAGGSRAFDNVTEGKCAAAQAQLCNLVLFGRTKPWQIKPTPIPDLPAKVQNEAIRRVMHDWMAQGIAPEASLEFIDQAEQMAVEVDKEFRKEADSRAERMQHLIEDQFAEAHFDDVFRKFAYDFVTYEVAGIMGPIPKAEVKTAVLNGSIQYENHVVLSMERMDPLGIYPAAMSEKPSDGDFFYRKLIGDDAALDCAHLPNLIPGAFDRAYRRRGMMVSNGNADQTMSEHEKNIGKAGDTYNPDGKHELIYWWHRMSRREAAGARREDVPTDKPPEERIPYMGLMLNGVVITCEENWNKTGKPQVHLCCFREIPGSIFGKGVSALMENAQNDRNVARRALNTNILFSAQLSRIIYPQLLENPQAATVSFPGQCYVGRLSNMPNDSRRPIEPVETPNNTNALLLALRQADQTADDSTGIYPQAYGSNRQVGPAETKGGYQMLREDQSIILKLAIANMENCLRSLVEDYWLWNMCSRDCPDSCKGDQKIVATGAVKLFLDTDNENVLLNLFQMLVSSAQVLAPYLSDQAFPNLIRRLLEIQGGDPDAYVRPIDEIAQEVAKQKQMAEQQEQMMMQMQQQQMQQQQAGAQQPQQQQPAVDPRTMPVDPNSPEGIKAQAAMIKAQAAWRKVELEEQKIAIDAQTANANIQKIQSEDAARLLQSPKAAGGVASPASVSAPAASSDLTEEQIQNTPSIPELMAQQGVQQ